jgi:hypothetical protein
MDTWENANLARLVIRARYALRDETRLALIDLVRLVLGHLFPTLSPVLACQYPL